MVTLCCTGNCSRSNDIYNFDRTFFAFYHYVLNFSARCFGVNKKSLKEKQKCYSFNPKIKAPQVENHEIKNICRLFQQMQYTKGEDDIGTVAFEMKLLMTTNNNANDGRLTMTDADWWQQVIWVSQVTYKC